MYKVLIGNICFNFRKLSDADYFARKNGKVVFGIAKTENEKEFTMKVSEMNERQKQAFYNIYWAANDLSVGLKIRCLTIRKIATNTKVHTNYCTTTIGLLKHFMKMQQQLYMVKAFVVSVNNTKWKYVTLTSVVKNG